VPQPPARQGEELAIVGHPEQHLRDRQGDQLGVAELRRAPWPAVTRTEKIIDLDIESDDEGVERGGHSRPPKVDGA
jgi:hypothetical protein